MGASVSRYCSNMSSKVSGGSDMLRFTVGIPNRSKHPGDTGISGLDIGKREKVQSQSGMSILWKETWELIKTAGRQPRKPALLITSAANSMSCKLQLVGHPQLIPISPQTSKTMSLKSLPPKLDTSLTRSSSNSSITEPDSASKTFTRALVNTIDDETMSKILQEQRET